jgi:putative spermidine/putrescine transport system permease protein
MTSVPDPSQKHQRREHGLMLALVSPALLVILALIVLPVGWLAWQSIYHDGFTLENYRRVFTEDIYWRSFALTFEISLFVTVLALLLGYPVAYAANAMPRGWGILILALVVLPFWTSVLVRSYAWLILLQRRGIINSALTDLGLIDSPLLLVNNELGTVIATIHILLPFMVLPLYAALDRLDKSLIEASLDLGAGHFRTLFSIVVPLALPGIISGIIITFVPALGAYLTPDLLGGPDSQMIANVIERQFKKANDWPFGAALSFLLMYATFAAIALRAYFSRGKTAEGHGV